MFGHQSDKKDDTSADQADAALSEAAQAAGGQVTPSDNTWQHPGTPIDDTQVADDVISPAGGYPQALSLPPNGVLPADSTPAGPAMPLTDETTTHQLIDIKQKALSELLPLINQLDQPPDEKFRTIMMMIQASDDERLVKVAYETAHSITDEKARARALLDIVNEINYFTQQPQS